MSTVISIEGLSKAYRLGAIGGATLREDVARWWAKTRGRPDPFLKIGEEHKVRLEGELFWALRDVSFDVREGEILGIIGRNGAGKSTLLKILARVTGPTEGEVRLRGRIASLLEVGTGFHPELTGRENIFLNGAILGMTKAQIRTKFDEIVSFSGVEQFIDTPVKRYSSGMYVRLAFAVAAHLEPDILVVDEVLAVGDAAFQKKCLGKMSDVAAGGRTILFVSHNMAAITALCKRCIWVAEGGIVGDGDANAVVSSYLADTAINKGERVWPDIATAPGNERVRIRAVRVVSGGKVTSNVDISAEITIEFEYWNLTAGASICTSVHLMDGAGVGVLASANLPSATLYPDPWFGREFPAGLFCASCTIPADFLNEGRYKINAIVLSDVINTEARVDEAVEFTVYDSGEMRREYVGQWLGVVRPKLPWMTRLLANAEACGSRSVERVESP